ncbi:MAG: ABC transporter ATP-binding protein [Bacillota bacterium]|jgi:peptide/nickel transport system ATP-binding protein|nr:ABC transporter ATP-binding protein [Bacillota bacterium]HOC07130.1 ABC transporter ATP-binding protein [Bacillota bacterium]HPZ22672.1 ABC transporter ATP-binding protein [Bacillota bacterium]HQD20166.1 ABC transporter ATP-binding protein [Bacillota bacterium]
MALLEVNNLKTHFHTAKGIVPAVDGVDFSVSQGETLGLVGESGCGKSVTALSIMGLVPSPPGKVTGKILFDGRDVLSLSEKEMRRLRGNEMAMIFQEPMSALNPVLTIGEQIAEAIRLHQDIEGRDLEERTIDMMQLVGISMPEKRFRDYPHQLSGGMRQRVLIAMALSCNPKLLFADEPSTALDVTIQAQILELLKQLRTDIDTAIVLISHDLGVIAEMADRVIVMYAGKFVEEASVNDLFHNPLHPYTEGLLLSVPRLDKPVKRLRPITGSVPDLLDLPAGCSFHPRCSYAKDICRQQSPILKSLGAGRRVSCWLR